MAKALKTNKRTGVALPLGSLRTKGCEGIGDYLALKEALPWVEKAGLTVVQLLPVNDTGTQSSPYSALSAMALHPIYIRIQAVAEFEELCKTNASFKEEYDGFIKGNPSQGRYNYKRINDSKEQLLRALFAATPMAQGKMTEELSAWIKANPWAAEYAVYKNLKWRHLLATWKSWPKEDTGLTEEEIKKRWKSTKDLSAHLFYAWEQMRAAQQFEAAAKAAKDAGIVLKGDLPILMNEDSCDAWAHPDIFKQSLRAGSPPDGENPMGQNWGFPTYNWKYLKKTDYAWWVKRLQNAARYYTAYRLDHLLGFFRIWAVPEREEAALLGHTEPYKAITQKDLQALGFDEGRIRWLCEPHVWTGVVEDITWNHDAAHKVLSKCMTQIGTEEMWLFKSTVKGGKDIREIDLTGLVDEGAAKRIKDALLAKWRDRCLVQAAAGKYAPLWTYTSTTAWKSLNDAEKGKLAALFGKVKQEEEALWQKQAGEILGVLTQSVKMTPCGEDLGVSLEGMSKVMAANGILSLKVVRWCRDWGAAGAPFVPFADYPILSVATTSVHDSATLREWWETLKSQDKSAFAASCKEAFGGKKAEECAKFTPEVAESILMAAAQAKSVWCIHPLQDWLYMKGDCYLPNAADERVNVPGQVSEFNWTYRMPVSVEDLLADEGLAGKIRAVVQAHAGAQ